MKVERPVSKNGAAVPLRLWRTVRAGLTAIGPGFYLGHFGGVVINSDATIGSNVNVGRGVTIGTESRERRAGALVIENRVWIGSHAIIVGRVTVENDALIARGSFISFDVPPSDLGNPEKIVLDSGSVGYINRVPDAE
jgi:serine O-acetyltransferase